MTKSQAVLSAFSFALLLVAASASAEIQGGPKIIDWNEFKDRCANPTKYPDIQVQPTNIRYQCTSVEHLWVAEEPGTIPMTGDRAVTGSVASSKFTVGQESKNLTVPGQTGTCPRYKEVTRTTAIEVPVSCDDILYGKGGGKDNDMSPEAYCEAQLGKGQHPKETVQTDTGREISTCAGVPGAIIPKP